MQKIVIIAFCLFNLLAYSYAQTKDVPQDPVSLHSPNVAALGMYGEVPVSYFTGVPDIEIPLYTLKEKEITLPISLSYHASGFRPDQHPGWTGNGWSLQAGGVVTRIVHNLPDDNDDTMNGITNGIGFYYCHSGIGVTNWSNADYLKNTIIGNSINYLYDLEPDEFDFNFAGYSGKFYMDESGVYHAVGDKGIQITLINPQQPMIHNYFSPDVDSQNNPFSFANLDSFAGFIITTTDGTQYIFGGTNAAIEYSKDFFHEGTTSWVADSWYLTKIIGPDGSQISFTYQRGPYINQLSSSIFQKSTSTTVLSPVPWYNFWTLNPESCSSYNPLNAALFGGKLISPLYLSQISSEQATINFTNSPTTELALPSFVYPITNLAVDCGHTNATNPYCTDDFYDLHYYNSYNEPQCILPGCFTSSLIWQELDGIQIIKNDNNQLLKQWNFTYTHDATQRLTLLNLQEQSGSGLLIPPYRFYYDQSIPLPATSFPGYFSTQVDHWGFWNGTTAPALYTTGQIINPTGYFSLRQPNPLYATAGTLNRIIYPTSAVTTFLFEPHTYSSEVDSTQRWNPLITNTQDQYAGGLRIKQITTADPNFPAQQKTKQYFYINNFNPSVGFTGRSSGVLGARAQYYWPNYTIKDVTSNQATNISVFSSQSVLPASENSMGSHIGYSAVIEKDQDGSVTQYEYTNFDKHPNLDNGHMDDPYITDIQPNSSAYVPYNSKALERGKLLVKNIYSAAGLLLNSTSFTYTAQTTNPIRVLKANRLFTCNSGVLGYEEGIAYEFYMYPYLPTTTTSVLYDNNGLNPQTTIKNTSYESLHNFVSQETTTDSKSRLVSCQS